jgi:hypothetical protein
MENQLTTQDKLKNLAAGAAADLRGWAGVHITSEQWLELVNVDPAALDYFTDEVECVGAYEQPSQGLDTCVRDAAFDVVARHATGRDWPIGAESEEVYREFRQKLNRAFKVETR